MNGDTEAWRIKVKVNIYYIYKTQSRECSVGEDRERRVWDDYGDGENQTQHFIVYTNEIVGYNNSLKIEFNCKINK